MRGFEVVYLIGFVEIFGFDVKVVKIAEHADIVHVHTQAVGVERLKIERNIEVFARVECGTGCIAHIGVPRGLIVEPQTIVHAGYDRERKFLFHLVTDGKSDIAQTGYLFGQKRTVGKILVVRTAQVVGAERHFHLAERQRHTFDRKHAHIRIEHFSFALIRKVYLGLVGHYRMHIAGDADAGVAHHETMRIECRTIFVPTTYSAVNLGDIVCFRHLFDIERFAFVHIGCAGIGRVEGQILPNRVDGRASRKGSTHHTQNADNQYVFVVNLHTLCLF